MKEEIYGDVKQYITALADNLGVAAEHVYGLLVRQQVISGWVWLAVSVIVLLISVAILVFTVVANVKAEWEDSIYSYSRRPKNRYAKYLKLGDEVFSLVLALIAVVLFIIFSIVAVYSALQIANPEYYAIKEIMDVFKGGE